MKRLIFAVAATVISYSAFASCQVVGNQTFCDNGTSYNRIGNTTYGSDGSTYRRIGDSNITQKSDGATYQQINNTAYGSDGTTSRRIGNTIYGSDRPIGAYQNE